MEYKPTDRFGISSEVLSQEVNGETVLLDLDGECYFGLNEVGTRIWQLLGEGQNYSALLETLCGEYQVSPGQLAIDLGDLLKKLTEAGLVSLAND